MSLRLKVALVIGGIIAGILSVAYLIARLILLDGFVQVEQDETRRDLERVRTALERQINYLATTTTDWAFWDDTYTFVQTGNADYIEANLLDEVFANLNLNLMVFVNSDGQIVFAKAYDLVRQQEVSLPDGLNEHLSQDGLLLSNGDASSLHSGLIRLTDGPLIVAARPILTSTREGPSQGTLIFGAKLDDFRLAQLAESTQTTLKIYPWDDPALTGEVRAVRDSLSEQSPVKLQPLNNRQIAGYILLFDIYGQPALILRADFPRHIFAHGQTTLNYLLVVMLVFGLLGGVVIQILFEKKMLAQTQTAMIFEHSSDFIILTRPDGRIQRVNPAFRRMLNGSASWYEKQSLSALFEGDLADSVTKTLREVVDKREDRQIDVVLQSSSGVKLNANMALSPIYDGRGQVSGVFCSLRDITARKNLEEHLRKEVIRIQELNEERARMISIISHELRNPLTSIQLATEALAQYEDRMNEQEKQKTFSRIKASIQQMRELSDDILTFNRTEAGKLTVEPAHLDIIAVCQKVINDIQAAFRNSRTIVFSAQGVCSEAIMDQRILQLIVSNLLSNAIKYSSSTINSDLVCGDDRVVLRIKDEGIGIPLEAQAKLFEPFFRAHNVKGISGTGLGLAIVKQAVELHGGTITFESQPNVGTTFTVTLPYLAMPTGA